MRCPKKLVAPAAVAVLVPAVLLQQYAEIDAASATIAQTQTTPTPAPTPSPKTVRTLSLRSSIGARRARVSLRAKVRRQAARTRVSRHAPSVTSLPWLRAWAGYPAPLVWFATCVAHHESWSSGLWTALNGGIDTSASGFAQWEDATWRANEARAGVPFTRRAYLAPPSSQVRVFAWMFEHHEQLAWAGANCGYGT